MDSITSVPHHFPAHLPYGASRLQPSAKRSQKLTFAGKNEEEDLNPDDLEQIKLYVANSPLRMITLSVASKTTNPAVMRYLAQEFKRQFRNVDYPALPLVQVNLLQIAISKGNSNMVQTLLEEGADPRTCDKAGNDAFDWLEKKVNPKVPKKDRQAIEKMLNSRLQEVVQKPRVSGQTPASQWSLFPLWGKLFNSQAETPSPEQSFPHKPTVSEPMKQPPSSEPLPETSAQPSKSNKTANQPEIEQPDPEMVSTLQAREAELNQKLATMKDNYQKTQTLLKEARQKITEQETCLEASLAKNKKLSEQLAQTNQSKTALEFRLKQEVNRLDVERKNLQKRFASLEEKKSSGERLIKRKANELQAESERLRQEIQERDKQIQTLNSRLTVEALAQDKAKQDADVQLSVELEKQREAFRQTSERQLNRLRMTLKAEQQKALQAERKQLASLRNQLAKTSYDRETEKGRHQSSIALLESKRATEAAELLLKIQDLNQTLTQQSEESLAALESRLAPLQQTIQEIEEKNRILTSELANKNEQAEAQSSRHKTWAAKLLVANQQLMSQLSDEESKAEQHQQERDALWEQLNQSHQVNEDLASRFNAQGWHLNSLWQAWMGSGQALQNQSIQMMEQSRKFAEQTERLDEQHEQLRRQAQTIQQTQARKSVLAKAFQSLMEFSAWKSGVSQRKDSVSAFVMDEVLKTIEEADSLEEARQALRETARFREEQMQALSIRQQFERPAKPLGPQKLTRSKSFG